MAHPDWLRELIHRTGCEAGTVEQASKFGEIAILAIPLSARSDLPAEALVGKIVIDAMNSYPKRDRAFADRKPRRDP